MTESVNNCRFEAGDLSLLRLLQAALHQLRPQESSGFSSFDFTLWSESSRKLKVSEV